jgi:tetratricopeptide (TPR) repeat protein
MQDKAEKLSEESLIISDHIYMVSRLSNLALRLYSWYIKNGHARNEEDETDVKTFFKSNLPPNVHQRTDFYEKLYLYQSYTWYAFIRQDFLMYYRYSQKWVDIYERKPAMIGVETGHFIKGMHTLLNAHFDLHNFQQFQIVLKKFEDFAASHMANQHDNFRVHTVVYILGAKINWHLMTGTFKEGLALIPTIEQKMEEYALYIDRHRILVFNYKIASIYFGSGNYGKCIDYLNRIINDNADLRNDLQCYARLMRLMAHYEMGNTDILESLIKSVYRFMAKMKNLTVVEEEMFHFLRQSFTLSSRALKPELEKFLHKIKHLEKNRFETRSFAYIDIISWVESKVLAKPMSQIIYEKYLTNRRRIYKEESLNQ